jgi:hypothetical protein
MSINTSNRLLISEILQKVSNAKTKAEKIKILQDNNSQALRSLLIWNYDESIISMIPEGEVPFEANEAPAGTEHTVLEKEYSKLYYFIKGGADNIKQFKREEMFIRTLEGLHISEAELLILVKDKQIQKKYRITKAVVEEAFPQIKWGGRS